MDLVSQVEPSSIRANTAAPLSNLGERAAARHGRRRGVRSVAPVDFIMRIGPGIKKFVRDIQLCLLSTGNAVRYGVVQRSFADRISGTYVCTQ